MPLVSIIIYACMFNCIVYLHVSACKFVCRRHTKICIYLTIKSEYESQQKTAKSRLSISNIYVYPQTIFSFYLGILKKFWNYTLNELVFC